MDATHKTTHNRMPATAPISSIFAPMPSTPPSLAALEADLEGLLAEYALLAEAHHIAGGRRRTEIGEQAEGTLARIHRIERAIVMTPATDLAGAAVQLRRLGAILDGDAEARRLVASVIKVVEATA